MVNNIDIMQRSSMFVEGGYGDDGSGIFTALEELRRASPTYADLRKALSHRGYESADRLQKALQAGSGSTWQSTSSGAPLRFEDLMATFVVTTFTWDVMEKTLFQRLLKIRQTATDVEKQYIRITGWGSGGAFSSEVQDLNTQDVSLQRANSPMKYLRSKRQVGDVLKYTAGGQRADYLQVRGAQMFIAENAERYFYAGNPDVMSVEPTGIHAAIASVATRGVEVIDLQGAAPDRSHLIELLGVMASAGHYARVTDGYTDIEGGTFLQDALLEAKERILVYPDQAGNYTRVIPYSALGTPNIPNGVVTERPLTGLMTRHGTMALWDNPFVGLRRTVPTAATSSNAPSTPSISVAETTGTNWFKASDLGVYRVRVSAENTAGESLACTASTCELTALTNVIRVTITPGATRGLAYRVYVSPPGGAAGSERLVGRVADSGGSTTTFDIDFDPLDQLRPHCSPLYLLQVPPHEDPEMRALDLAVLAMGRKNLPEGDTYGQFVAFLYYAHLFYAPARMVMLANMGSPTYTNGWPS